jgi:hypothetical protein
LTTRVFAEKAPAACSAHAMRKFFEAVKLNPRDQTSIRIVAQMDELL